MVFSHGVTGGKGRCYPFWQDFMYCMARVGALHGEKCSMQFEDYFECLHHTKSVGDVALERSIFLIDASNSHYYSRRICR